MEPRTDERSQDFLQDRGSSKHRIPIPSERSRIWKGRPADVIETVLAQIELDHEGTRCKGSHQGDKSTQRFSGVELALRMSHKGLVRYGSECCGEIPFGPASGFGTGRADNNFDALASPKR